MTIPQPPRGAWVLGVLGEPLCARRADTDYLCGSCGRVVASIPHTARLSQYTLVQYEAFNEYCPKEVPGLPDYLQPYTDDADYMDFYKPKYNIKCRRTGQGKHWMAQPTIVICYACGANNITT
jgi:hypothetical protein